MKINQAFYELRQKLTEDYTTGEAATIADWVLTALTGKGRLQRLITEEPLSAAQCRQLEDYTEALLAHKPVQYVLGTTFFYGLPISVNEHVLIPRPETEELVDWLLSVMPESSGAGMRLLDIGTGSGCIALVLKHKLPYTEVYATDSSLVALEVAGNNAAQLGLTVDFSHADILDPQADSALRFDIIISNPPYITRAEAEAMLPHVLDFEPHQALFVTNDDPLQFYKAIEGFARRHLVANGSVFLELNSDYALQTEDYFKQSGWQTLLRKDMQGNLRMLRATFAESV